MAEQSPVDIMDNLFSSNNGDKKNEDKNTDQDETLNSDDLFENGIQDISSMINDDLKDIPELQDDKKNESSTKSKRKNKKQENDIKQSKTKIESETDKHEQEQEQEQEEQKKHKINKEKTKNLKDKETTTNIEVLENSINKNDEVWDFVSKSSKFDNFYELKRKVIVREIGDKKINIDKMLFELNNLSVNIGNVGLDPNVILEKMTQVTMNAQRLSEIAGIVYPQYFLVERLYSLLCGALSRVEYIKPQHRQEGIIMEHLSDLSLYLSGLTSLKDIISFNYKTLSLALETLNRKVTASLNERGVGDYTRKGNNNFNNTASKEDMSTLDKHTMENKKEITEYKKEENKSDSFDDIFDDMDSIGNVEKHRIQKRNKDHKIPMGYM